MAIFGDVGRLLGLGTTKQTLAAGAQGFLRGAIAGQPFMGAAGGALTAGTQQGQATAVAVPQAPPAETAFSGETIPVGVRGMPAPRPSYMPGIQPAVFRQVNDLVPRPGTDVTPIAPSMMDRGGALAMILGLGAGAVIAPEIFDPTTGQRKKLRVTRRLRSQVKKAVEMFGVEAVAEQMQADVETIFYILTKKMRNDGPYVTKAAVRKTRQTVRKMKNLCDMYDDLRPAARRRAPARKTMATRITNVK